MKQFCQEGDNFDAFKSLLLPLLSHSTHEIPQTRYFQKTVYINMHLIYLSHRYNLVHKAEGFLAQV